MLTRLLEAAVVSLVVAMLLQAAVHILTPLLPVLAVVAGVMVVGRWLMNRNRYW